MGLLDLRGWMEDLDTEMPVVASGSQSHGAN